ncbi:LuxR C-terminal-related transcriptional regulator [Streptomyces sp. NPDC056773]|uniref:LuxR C-terminal-related transcriptional regulator n=1 Tax=unclassified Streptomyces TaxID=2593676 RepID=UPI003695167D
MEPLRLQDAAAPIRVAAVDDQELILEGLAASLARTAPDIAFVAIAEDVDSLLAQEDGATASVVLLDLRLSDDSDIGENVRRIRATGARVLAHTTERRPAPIRRALAAGALGLILKEDPLSRLAEAVRTAHAGEAYVSSRLAHEIVNDPRGDIRLTPQQHRVLELIARGLPHGQIAKHLHITEETVRTHRKRAIEAYTGAGDGLLGQNSELVWRVVADGHIDIGPELPDIGPELPGTPGR